MRKKLFYVVMFCCFSLLVFAQTDGIKSVIILKNGSVFTGEIIAQTESAVILKATDDTRYQFPVNDIEKIETADSSVAASKSSEIPASMEHKTAVFQLMADAGTGFYLKNGAFSAANCLSGSLVLGFNTHTEINDNAFYGFGAGYENIFAKPKNVDLLKIFFRIQKQFPYGRRVSPFTSLDLGYSLISIDGWSGGFFAKAKGGISINVGGDNCLFLGINIGIQGCNTTLSQTRDNENYQYRGTAFLPEIGISAAIMF